MDYKFLGVVEEVSDGFSIYFPELTGCVSHGSTFKELHKNSEEAVALHIQSLLEESSYIGTLGIPTKQDIDAMESGDTVMLIEVNVQED